MCGCGWETVSGGGQGWGCVGSSTVGFWSRASICGFLTGVLAGDVLSRLFVLGLLGVDVSRYC